MRKFKFIKLFFTLVFIAGTVVSCQNKQQTKLEEGVENREQNAKGEIYSGELTFTPEAAVFVGSSFIYGVTINDVAEELAKRVEAVKTDIHDIVPVTVRGEVTPNTEGHVSWDEILTITEIIDVSDTAKQPDVRLK